MPFSIAKAAGCYRIEQMSVICLLVLGIKYRHFKINRRKKLDTGT